ncbi:MAG: hypothetical protein M1536_05990 [Firmicutes bacterium]|nr:hypothetical protein [Bacillota bacterium]
MRNYKKASALIFSLFIVSILFVLSLAFFTITGGDYFFSGAQRNSLNALFLAQGGVEYSYFQSAEWDFPHNETIKLSTGTCEISAAKNESTGEIVLECTGVSGKFRKTVSAILYQGAILNWHEK